MIFNFGNSACKFRDAHLQPKKASHWITISILCFTKALRTKHSLKTSRKEPGRRQGRKKWNCGPVELWTCDKWTGFGLPCGALGDPTVLFQHQVFRSAENLAMVSLLDSGPFVPCYRGRKELSQPSSLFFPCSTLFQRKWLLEAFTVVNDRLNSVLVLLFNCCSVFSDSHPELQHRENRQ